VNIPPSSSQALAQTEKKRNETKKRISPALLVAKAIPRQDSSPEWVVGWGPTSHINVCSVSAFLGTCGGLNVFFMARWSCSPYPSDGIQWMNEWMNEWMMIHLLSSSFIVHSFLMMLIEDVDDAFVLSLSSLSSSFMEAYLLLSHGLTDHNPYLSLPRLTVACPLGIPRVFPSIHLTLWPHVTEWAISRQNGVLEPFWPFKNGSGINSTNDRQSGETSCATLSGVTPIPADEHTTCQWRQ